MEFIRAQRTRIPPVTPVNLASSTVLITGANAGLGFEAAGEVLQSKPKRLILAVRNMEKGNAAKAELEKAKDASTNIEVRKLDQQSFESVRSFVKDLKGERVDFAILNAGVWNTQFNPSVDGLESGLQVNTLAPALLSLLLLPNLRLAASSASLSNAPKPHLTFVSSGLHETAKFPERKLDTGGILAALNDPKKYKQSDRYPTTKAIGLFWMRELASKVSSSEVIVNAVNPGFCKTDLASNVKGIQAQIMSFAGWAIGRPALEGGRCLVDAAVAQGPETHGKYVSELKVKAESSLVNGPEGKELQGKLWEETMALLKKHGGLDDSVLSS
ncbi:hypothetical protein MMC30_003331 [Trapelia coarctata]|nr:hypothetical protein [Trapelia coarctata]